MIQPVVSVVMGSTSDWATMRETCLILEELGISFEKRAISAHRTPDELFSYVASLEERGLEVVIAGAGGAAHLAGVIAAKTLLPVIGVPMKSETLNGIDSLLSIVQMPGGVPVATVGIGKAGAINAGLLAAEVLSLKYPEIKKALITRREVMREKVLANTDLQDYQ